jgi:hypothetical protein
MSRAEELGIENSECDRPERSEGTAHHEIHENHESYTKAFAYFRDLSCSNSEIRNPNSVHLSPPSFIINDANLKKSLVFF